MDWKLGARLAVAVAITAFAACKEDGHGDVSVEDAPDEAADVLCSAKEACDCDPTMTGDACRTAAATMVQAVIDEGQQQGLTYDGSCVGQILDYYDELGCATDFAGDGGDCSVCKLFYGDVGEGEACSAPGTGGLVGDECAQGLVCSGTNCVDPCVRAGEGEDCSNASCDEGLVCVFNTNDMGELVGTCQKQLGEGDDCTQGLCGEGLTCDVMTMTCATAPGLGETCSGTCSGDAYCDTTDTDPTNWTCTATKGDGEACDGSLQCRSGDCSMGMCQAEQPVVCSAG